MVSGNFISIKSVADRLMMNPLLKEINFEFIIDKTVECLRLVNMSPIYIDKLENIEIKNYSGNIPSDLMYVEQVYYNINGDLIPMQKGSDIVHQHYDKLKKGMSNDYKFTYSIGVSKIKTNIEQCSVSIAYKAMAVDEECYPIIPDNMKLIRCIESYIKYKWFDILNDMDKISDRKLNKAETEYCFNVAQAQNDLIMPDFTEMEEFVNNVRQILPNNRQFNERMKYLGNVEHIRIQ